MGAGFEDDFTIIHGMPFRVDCVVEVGGKYTMIQAVHEQTSYRDTHAVNRRDKIYNKQD
jgi:hypothetical protein